MSPGLWICFIKATTPVSMWQLLLVTFVDYAQFFCDRGQTDAWTYGQTDVLVKIVTYIKKVKPFKFLL